MNDIWDVVDNTPTLYLVALAWLLHRIGLSLRERRRELVVWQDVAAGGTFAVLTLRRLVWDTPVLATDVVLVLLRAAAFSMIAYGVMGMFALMWSGLNFAWRKLSRFFVDRWQALQYGFTPKVPERPSSVTSRVPSQATIREQTQREEQQALELEKIQAARRRRKELRLQTELVMEFALDQGRRDKLSTLLNTYADDTLPVDEYEARLEQFRDAIQLHSPAKPTKYNSLQDILNDFASQLADVEESTQSDFEKDSLRAMIMNERQITIQRFIQS